MNRVLIVLFLVGFQAVCANGTPRSVSPRLNLTMHILPKEYHEDKRGTVTYSYIFRVRLFWSIKYSILSEKRFLTDFNLHDKPILLNTF